MLVPTKCSVCGKDLGMKRPDVYICSKCTGFDDRKESK